MDTASTTLTGPLAVFRESEIRLLTEIAETLAEMGDVAQDDRQHLLDVAQDLRDMFFLVVIIGEFNAGKSSFINALIEDDLLPTGITPTTEAIELIRYSETPVRKPNMREDGIREWGHPNTGAPGVALFAGGTSDTSRRTSCSAVTMKARAALCFGVYSYRPSSRRRSLVSATGPRAPYRARRSSPCLSLPCTHVSACSENPCATATRRRLAVGGSSRPNRCCPLPTEADR